MECHLRILGLAFILAASVSTGNLWAQARGGSPTSGAASGPASQPAQLTVATYNLNFGQHDRKMLAEIVANILKADADVVAIQEGNADIYKYLRAKLRKHYPHMQFYPGRAAHGLGWMSKTPLLDKALLPNKGGGWFRTAAASVKQGDKRVRLFNLHLYPTLPQNGDGLLGLMTRLKRDEVIRSREILGLWPHVEKAMKQKLPVVLLGDLNSPSILSVPQYLRDKDFVDSYAVTSKQPDTDGATWHWDKWRLRIDYIWHNALAQTSGCRIYESDASDHFLLVSTLKLHAGEPASKPAMAAK